MCNQGGEVKDEAIAYNNANENEQKSFAWQSTRQMSSPSVSSRNPKLCTFTITSGLRFGTELGKHLGRFQKYKFCLGANGVDWRRTEIREVLIVTIKVRVAFCCQEPSSRLDNSEAKINENCGALKVADKSDKVSTARALKLSENVERTFECDLSI